MSGFYPVDEIPDITKNNPVCVVYLCGNEFTDGSIRLILLPGDTVARLEVRGGGAWNLAPIDIAPETLRFGKNLSLSATGNYLQTESSLNGSVALVPHIHYDSSGSDIPHWPVLFKERESFQISAAPDPGGGTVVGKDIQTTFSSIVSLIATRLYLSGKSITPTTPWTITIRRNDINGEVYYQHKYPADEFKVATFSVQLYGKMEASPGDTAHLQLTSETDMSLLLSTTPGEIWAAIDMQILEKTEALVDNWLMDEDGQIIVDNDNQFVTERVG
jgi:hypothetical protein